MRSAWSVFCFVLWGSAVQDASGGFVPAAPLSSRKSAVRACPALSIGGGFDPQAFAAPPSSEVVQVLDRVSNTMALFGLPSYDDARPFTTATSTFDGHEQDIFVIGLLVVVFPTVVTILLTQMNSD